MTIRSLLLVPLLAVAAACGGSDSASDAVPAAGADNATGSTIVPSDMTIAALVYNSQYSVPEGFFVDERADTERSYTVHHVLDDSSSFEVCTDDFAEAQRWEDEDNASRSVQGYYMSAYENERYFEFIRELAYTDDVGNVDDVTSPGFGRVFKCSSVDRTGVDRNLLDGYSGTIRTRPITPGALRTFAEYLWQFAYFPNARKKVIDSMTVEQSGKAQQILLLAFATRQGLDSCDLIEVVEWRFEVDLESGAVHRSFVPIRRFEARLADGAPSICG